MKICIKCGGSWTGKEFETSCSHEFAPEPTVSQQRRNYTEHLFEYLFVATVPYPAGPRYTVTSIREVHPLRETAVERVKTQWYKAWLEEAEFAIAKAEAKKARLGEAYGANKPQPEPEPVGEEKHPGLVVGQYWQNKSTKEIYSLGKKRTKSWCIKKKEKDMGFLVESILLDFYRHLPLRDGQIWKNKTDGLHVQIERSYINNTVKLRHLSLIGGFHIATDDTMFTAYTLIADDFDPCHD